MFAEVGGGILSGSLAILTDAAHMCSDVAGFGISIIAIYVAQKSPNKVKTYGYHRAEVLGALGSILIIWMMIVWLCYEATQRMINPDLI